MEKNFLKEEPKREGVWSTGKHKGKQERRGEGYVRKLTPSLWDLFVSAAVSYTGRFMLSVQLPYQMQSTQQVSAHHTIYLQEEFVLVVSESISEQTR
jgi:hypothetical protein